MKKLLLLAFFLAIAILLLLWYQKNSAKLLTADDYEPDTYTVIDESDALVDEFPNLPQYPNANIVNSRQYKEEGGLGFSSEYSTNDSVLDVVDWYKQQLPQSGWTLIYESELVNDPSFYLIEYKKPDIQLDVHVVELNDGTKKITITHHQGMGEYGPKVKYE